MTLSLIRPVVLKTEEVPLGASFYPIYTFEMNGTPIDFALSQYIAQARVRKQGATAAPTTKTVGVGAETTFPTPPGTNGKVRFNFGAFTAANGYTEGWYDIDLWLKDAGAPTQWTLYATGLLRVPTPATGVAGLP